MTQKQFMALIALTFILLSLWAHYLEQPIGWAVAIILSNLWAIAAYFKE